MIVKVSKGSYLNLDKMLYATIAPIKDKQMFVVHFFLEGNTEQSRAVMKSALFKSVEAADEFLKMLSDIKSGRADPLVADVFLMNQTK